LNYLLAILTGVLLTLSFPRYDYPWLMTVALTPLLLACWREPRWTRRLLIGWLAGAVTLGGVTDWIRFVVTFHGGLGTALGFGVFLLFCIAKGFYFGAFAALARPFLGRWWSIPGVAALWVAVDITLGSALFQWVTLGNAASNMSVPMRLAPITGVHGLSFVFMMMAAAVAQVILRQPRGRLMWLLALPLLILLPELPEAEAPTATVAALQPNIEEEQAWGKSAVEAMSKELALMSLRAALRNPDLLVWPEVPAPFYYFDDPEFRDLASGLAKAARVPFLLGTVGRTNDGLPLNSALLLAPSGEPAAQYNKIHLVPFGEYVPWPFGFAGKIVAEVGDFQPGQAIVTPQVNGHKLGVFICYESAFPTLVRRFVQNGAEALLNLSNDGYFGRSLSARGQHLLVVRMRAAENARWIVRATNDGITASVDPAGRVVKRLPPFERTIGEMPFSYKRELTFYTRHGDWFGWTCAGLCVIKLLLELIHSRKPKWHTS
jgi:apolipoprotein N-acyltransferase